MAEHVDLGQATARQARDGAVVALEGFTPMGNLMRRYWLPAVLSSELVGPDSGPIRLRILGEDLVAFRDSKGRVGILEALCPHRRAPLYFGRNEESGLTCIYHGWKFSVDGACLAMPNVPSQSDFRPEFGGCFVFCLVRGGLVVACFHYMGGVGGWWWG